MTLASVIERSSREKESWRYTDIKTLLGRNIASTDSSLNIHRIFSGPFLVFVDGIFQPRKSVVDGIPAGSDNIVQEDGTYHIVIHAETCLIMQPLELLFITTGKIPEASIKLSITLSESARLTIMERHEGSASQIIETNIVLGKQAKFVHERIIKSNAPHISTIKTVIDEGAFYNNFTLIKDGPLVRNEIEAKLAGKLAQCTLNAVMLLRGTSHADTTTHIHHIAPDGTSRQTCKSVITDKARGVFQGKITVAEGAQKTDAQQLSRALLLSDQAEMDAKPELKIYADDVKCSHGASIGALDDDALFYLRARGLDENQARALLIRGFAGEILDEIQILEWRNYARDQMEAWCDEQD